MNPLHRRARLGLWQEAADNLAQAIDDERHARAALVDALEVEMREGAHHFDIDGQRVTVTRKVNRTVIDANLSELENAEALQALAIEKKLFRAKLELSATAWKSLTTEQQAAFAPAVRESFGLPSIEVKEPKK